MMNKATHLALAINMLASIGLPAAEAFEISEDYGKFEHNRVLAFNASQFSANNPSEYLSQYAIRYSDPNQADLAAIQRWFAPAVPANQSRSVNYSVYGFSDQLLTLDNLSDDIRAIGADFNTLRNPSKSRTTQDIPNRGLAVEVDEDEEQLDPDWQQQKVAWLIAIIERTRLRQTINLAIAGATSVGKTWDASAGKDPDQDVLTEIDSLIIRPNRAAFGPGAWTKRNLAHRAQNTAGGFASAKLRVEELAGEFELESARVIRPRRATGSDTVTDLLGSYVLLFTGFDSGGRHDFSNLKTFTARTKSGGRYTVYVRQVGDKRWRIAVECNELVALTSVLGLEVMPIS